MSDGVTIVVSPLKSLIEDQRYKMKELEVGASYNIIRLYQISCEALTGELSAADAEKIYSRLTMNPPNLKMLYVTPEKV